ncbi:MAG: 50S ribosomal protein L10 [Gammaproteobacteria bacterium]|nr:50S ribosomal protein L10 [Gammaproteobacteria bacterium]
MKNLDPKDNKQRQAKLSVVNQVYEISQQSQSMIIAEYRGLSSQQMNELRVKARQSGVKLGVYKNSLVKRSMVNSSFAKIAGRIRGPLIYGFSSDAVTAAKVLADFAKTNEKLVLKSGSYLGQVLTVEEIKVLANLPSKEVLLAQLCGLLNSPITRLAAVVGALAKAKESADQESTGQESADSVATESQA